MLLYLIVIILLIDRGKQYIFLILEMNGQIENNPWSCLDMEFPFKCFMDDMQSNL